MSIGNNRTPGGIIVGLTAVAVVTLVIAIVVLMQEPQSSQPQGKSDGGKGGKQREIVRLPEELTAEFQFREGWWVANGPANDDAMRRLTNKQQRIKNITLNQTAVSARGLDELKGHQLQSLELIDSEIDVSMAKSISRISGLKNLLLKDREVSDEVLKALTGPSSVESLLLKNATATSAGLKHLPSIFPELKSVTFINCKSIDDSVVPTLMKCRKLESLTLIATSMSANRVVQLVNRLPIVRLSFENQGQVCELVEKLRGTKLTSLCLRANLLNERVLERLSEMKSLKRLLLKQCTGLTSERLERLKKKLPGCEIRATEVESFPELGLVED